MKWTKVGISAIITLAIVLLLNFSFGSLPALGPFFNPVSGFWQSLKTETDARSEWLVLPALKDSVLVVYDDRLVPHIFAKNDHDLYFTQGYITAKDRLWQMDIQTRAAAGRLSEVLGERTLNHDLYQRRIGMVYGAQNKLNLYEQNPEILAPIQQYTEGVNYWIQELSPRHIPVEYKLFGYKPEKWTLLKSLLVHMNMSATLNGRTNSYQLSNTRDMLGDDFVEALYPPYPDWVDPIIPEGTEWPFDPIKLPGQSADDIEADTTEVEIQEPVDLEIPEADPSIGSNSWAVHGSKTSTGKPLLANDMHLRMTLPSIWYEVQLYNDGVNVYGVSLPGLPGVVVGFNEDIAWGFTNSGAAVMDTYRIAFRDNSWSEYYHDDEWKPTRYSVETILVKGKETVIDTVYYTHHGPVPHRVRPTEGSGKMHPAGHAVQWIAHKPSMELQTFYDLNRASGYEDYYESMKYFDGPAQNFTYADRFGNIALWHNGRFPVRSKGMGDFISDGSNPAHDWNAFIPHDHKPHVVNPDRGFVSSANQHPTHPDYPYFLGRFFASYERGARINQVLDGNNQLSYMNMMLLQLDTINLRSKKVMNEMISLAESSGVRLENESLFDDLKSWNHSMEAESHEAVIFHFWWNTFYDKVWDPIFTDTSKPFKKPSDAVTVQLLLEDQESEYFNKNSINSTIMLPQLVANSWNEAIQTLKNDDSDPANWQWWKYNDVDIPHVGNIPNLGRENIKTDGTNIAVNAIRKSHGPSWRMVVSLEEDIKAWGVFPGGQSGNPSSENYDAFIDPWAEGAYFPLHFYRSPEQAINHLKSGIITTKVQP